MIKPPHHDKVHSYFFSVFSVFQRKAKSGGTNLENMGRTSRDRGTTATLSSTVPTSRARWSTVDLSFSISELVIEC